MYIILSFYAIVQHLFFPSFKFPCCTLIVWHLQFTDKVASMLPQKYSQLGYAKSFILCFLFSYYMHKNMLNETYQSILQIFILPLFMSLIVKMIFVIQIRGLFSLLLTSLVLWSNIYCFSNFHNSIKKKSFLVQLFKLKICQFSSHISIKCFYIFKNIFF